jgi:4-amino-4-deoxy-L-arabinose transferase-like glycosyltransferase
MFWGQKAMPFAEESASDAPNSVSHRPFTTTSEEKQLPRIEPTKRRQFARIASQEGDKLPLYIEGKLEASSSRPSSPHVGSQEGGKLPLYGEGKLEASSSRPSSPHVGSQEGGKLPLYGEGKLEASSSRPSSPHVGSQEGGKLPFYGEGKPEASSSPPSSPLNQPIGLVARASLWLPLGVEPELASGLGTQMSASVRQFRTHPAQPAKKRGQFMQAGTLVSTEPHPVQPAKKPGQFITPTNLPVIRDTPAPQFHLALQDVGQQETRALPALTVRRRAKFVTSGRLPVVPLGRLHRGRQGKASVENRATQPENSQVQAPETTSKHVVLYRQANFSLHTVSRSGRQVNLLRKPTGLTAKIPTVLPHQKERVAISETRRMPRIDVRKVARTYALPMPIWLEILAVVLVLIGAVYLHAYNLFHFPDYALDEGTYMQNAWAVTLGRLSPYAYGYGHPPFGWIQVALWVKLTGLFSFGNAVNGGRVFMLFYSTGSALLVYMIARRLGGSISAAFLGLILFAYSPLSITFQREILLDNIATFWLLVSLYLLLASQSRLLYVVGAAMAFGIAMLSKEVLGICLPAMIYAAWLYITPFQRKFALVTFIYTTLALISTYILMALLKGEFFPYSWHLPWDTHPHLSMLDTLIHQTQRGQGEGSFGASWAVWWHDDALLISASLAAPAFNLVYGWRNRPHLFLALLSLSYWLLLVRGGVIFTFYFVPLIPLTALNAALALHALANLGGRALRVHFKPARAILLLLIVLMILPYSAKSSIQQASANPVSAQQEALSWIHSHLPHNSSMAISAYLYLDLHLPGGEGVGKGEPFPNAEVYWDIATDPTIYDGVLHNDWRHINYLVADKVMLSDIQNGGDQFTLLQQALAHSTLLVSFSTHDQIHQTTLWIYEVQPDDSLPLV